MDNLDKLLTNLGLPHWRDVAPWAIAGLFAVSAFIVGILIGRQSGGHRQPGGIPSEAPKPEQDTLGLDPFIFGSAQEQRQAARRRGNPVVVLVSDAAAKAPPYEATVIDRSTGGLCLEVHEEIPVGTTISVRASNAAGLVPWVQVQVKNTRQASHSWLLGCQFLRTPPSGVLWSFG